MKKAISAITAALVLFAGTATANAHTVLVYSNPKSGAIVKSLPKIITLRFAEPLLTLAGQVINKVSVTDQNGSIVTTGKNISKGMVLTNTFKSVVAKKGIYKVSYRVSAQDGHVVIGSYTFTLKN
jgi:methionine-rich copper-binding protein CopC